MTKLKKIDYKKILNDLLADDIENYFMPLLDKVTFEIPSFPLQENPNLKLIVIDSRLANVDDYGEDVRPRVVTLDDMGEALRKTLKKFQDEIKEKELKGGEKA